jgi:hypothetical protein
MTKTLREKVPTAGLPELRINSLHFADSRTAPVAARVAGRFKEPITVMLELVGDDADGLVKAVHTAEEKLARAPMKEARDQAVAGDMVQKWTRLKEQKIKTDTALKEAQANAQAALDHSARVLADGGDPSSTEKEFRAHRTEAEVLENRLKAIESLVKDAEVEAYQSLREALGKKRRELSEELQARRRQLEAELVEAMPAKLTELIRVASALEVLSDSRMVQVSTGRPDLVDDLAELPTKG